MYDLFITHGLLFLIPAIILIAYSVSMWMTAHLIEGKFSAICICLFGCASLSEYIRFLLPVEYQYSFHIWGSSLLLLGGLVAAGHLQLSYIQYTGLKKFSDAEMQMFGILLLLPIGIFAIAQSITYAIASSQYQPLYAKDGIWLDTTSPAIHTITYVCVSCYVLFFFAFIIYSAKHSSGKARNSFIFNGVVLFISVVVFALIFYFFDAYLPPEPFILLAAFVSMFSIIGSMRSFDFSPNLGKSYQAFLALSPQAIIVFDDRFDIFDMNALAKEKFTVEVGVNLFEYEALAQNATVQKILTQIQQKSVEREIFQWTIYDQPVVYAISATAIQVQKKLYYYAIFEDITKEFEQEQKNIHLAFHDPLTQWPNRAAFQQAIEPLLRNVSREQPGIFMLSDLNHFKQLNDTYGHHVGDEILIYTTQLMAELAPPNSIYARLGGDEFVFFMPNMSEALFQPYLTSFREHFKNSTFNGPDGAISITPSFGYAVASSVHHNYEWLYQTADAQMYQDKQNIKSQVDITKHISS